MERSDYFHTATHNSRLDPPQLPSTTFPDRSIFDSPHPLSTSPPPPNEQQALTSSTAPPASSVAASAEPTNDFPTRPPLTTKTSGSGSKKPVSSDGGGGDGGGLVKTKRTRNRKPASCAPCRKKKLRCNRVSPCDQCTAKNQEASCTWEGAEPLYTRRDEADTQELRDQVARLESLVRYLTSQKRDTPERLPSGSESPSSNFDSFPASNPPPPVRKPSYSMDLRSNDLCEGIAQLAVKEFVVVEGSGTDSWAPGHQRGLEMIDEARLFLRTMPQQFGVAETPTFSVSLPPSSTSFSHHSRQASTSQHSGPQSPTDSSFSSVSRTSMVTTNPLGTSFSGTPPSLDEVLKYLPPRNQAHSAYRYFVDYVSWYSNPIHQVDFEEKWRSLDAALQLADEEARNRLVDPFFISSLLGILATGLSMMPVKRALRDGFPEAKDRIVDRWLEGSMLALTCGGFLDNPSVEAVCASVILSTFFVFTATGERAGAGMGLLSLTVSIAHTLNLHRDPDRIPGKYSFFEAEQRRRLFWNLFSLCILSSSSLSRTWNIFDLKNIDCQLPLDCHDHEILDEATARAGLEKRKTKFAETPMTQLIIKQKLAVLAMKMNDRAFGINPVPYEEILALDAELREFEESIPARYRVRLDQTGALLRPTSHITVTEMRACMISISVTSEYIRLHRPWLLFSEGNKTFQYSRDQAVKHSQRLLAVYRSPSCAKSKWGGLTYKATNAAVVLAIDILAFPDQAEVELLRSTVRAVQRQMESQSTSSSLCRKGSRLIKFLMEKDGLLQSAMEERRQVKRTKVVDGTKSSFDGLRSAFDTKFTREPAFMHERDDDYEDDDFRHKSNSLESFSIPTPASSSAPPPHSRPVVGISPQPRLHYHPLESPDYQHSNLGTATNFSDFAGAFDFDFRLPSNSAPIPPSPTLTHDDEPASRTGYPCHSTHPIPRTSLYGSPSYPYDLPPSSRPIPAGSIAEEASR
ncbi:Zn(II)2Cys6 transcription factor [Sporobolomyces salmoneus]|uniref:Zn(II)2Cys6 transcription factor n=1 Tax=Sporobolomyces salmoneus TaxID=183962 RepID=UPI003174C96C